MGSQLIDELATVALAIVGLAMLAVLVSRNAQTPAVIQATASGFNNALDVAISPVTGNTAKPILNYPSTGGYGFTGNFPMYG
jgi:hypothetical protein